MGFLGAGGGGKLRLAHPTVLREYSRLRSDPLAVVEGKRHGVQGLLHETNVLPLYHLAGPTTKY